MMTHDAAILDRCTVDIRATFALLKARTLASLHELENPPLRVSDHADISMAFDAFRDDFLADSVEWLRAGRETPGEITAGRVAYSREISREDD